MSLTLFTPQITDRAICLGVTILGKLVQALAADKFELRNRVAVVDDRRHKVGKLIAISDDTADSTNAAAPAVLAVSSLTPAR